MEPIRVIVHGALGRVGQEVVKAICCDTGTQLVGAVDLKATGDSLILPDGSRTVPFSTDLDFILTSCRPEVMVDFTTAKATMPAVRAVAKQ